MIHDEGMTPEKEIAQLKIELADTQLKLLEAQAMLVTISKAKAVDAMQAILAAEKEAQCPQPSP